MPPDPGIAPPPDLETASREKAMYLAKVAAQAECYDQMADYTTTRTRVEDYFDRSATKVWERLTSDAPVSRIRQTVREGRDRMRSVMLGRLPDDLRGARCGTSGAMEILSD